ncbi:MAG: serine hydrolase [Planctomycetota bacterium]
MPSHRLLRLPLAVCLIWASMSQALAQPAPLQGLDDTIEVWLTAWDVPGLALAVVQDGEVVYARGYGVRRVDTDQPVNAETVFAVASNTKAFTATLLGQLVDEGKLSWDDRVIDHLPSFALFDPWVTREIRVRDLLCHRSGLPTFGGDHLWIGECQDQGTILEKLRYLEPTAPFRTRFQYQNLMFLVAGQVVEAVTGETWADRVQGKILEPLGMSSATTSVSRLDGQDNVAHPHEVRGGELKVVAFDAVDCIAPAGALNSSVFDMAQWMLVNLNGGRHDAGVLFSPSVLAEMQTVHTPRSVGSRETERFGRHFSGYGLGWGLSDYHGVKLVQHGGGLSGMNSLQTLVPEKNLGVMVATNFAPNSLTAAVTYHILDIYLGREPHDWNQTFVDDRDAGQVRAQGRETELEEQRIPGTSPSGPLEDFAGTYHDDFSGDTEVRLEEGALVFDYNPRHRGRLEHWHYDTFRVAWDDAIYDMPQKSFVTFRRGESGGVSGLTVTFYDPITFERVEDDKR